VAMGRAVIREPQVFLMDEPLSNLDAQLRVQMRGEIEALQKRLGVTTVYVTHDQVEAMTMGDRVAVLRDGLLQQADTPTGVYDRPANLFVAGFIGSPPMNIAQGTIERGSLRLGDQTITLPQEVIEARGLDARIGKPVIVGIRPEDLHGDEGPRDASLSGTIERVEALGASLLAYFTVDAEAPKVGGVVAAVTGEQLEQAPLTGATGVPFCATFEPRAAVRIGDRVEASFDVSRLHFFDPDTEVALWAPGR
jgi:multiple sugar transport system ATP-binding protein